MPKCTDQSVEFGRVGRRVVQAAFDGGEIVSDGDSLLLRQVDERIGLARMEAVASGDKRRRASVRHDMRSLLAQRVYGLCCGWEHVTDHNTLRHDLAVQTAVGRDEELASGPTLSRLENSATMAHAVALNGVLQAQFIASCQWHPNFQLGIIGLPMTPAATLHPTNSCWTSTPRTCRCTASRRVRTSMPTTTTTATCRCTCSAARTCWRECCARAGVIRPACSARWSSSLHAASGRPGRRSGSSCAATRAFATPRRCAASRPGASTTSSALQFACNPHECSCSGLKLAADIP